MFVDWLSIYQDHPGQKLPLVGDEIAIYTDIDTGEIKKKTVHSKQKRGSYDSSIVVRCDGMRVSMSGNPSRWEQRDSLFGVTSVSESVNLYNKILKELGLPPFTRNTLTQSCRKRQLQKDDSVYRTGAVITRIDDATNYMTGSSLNSLSVIEYLAGERHQGHTGLVYPNGCTVDWKGRSQSGKGSRFVYFKYYAKWAEPGCDKTNKDYYQKLTNWCKKNGIIRFEVSLKSMLLKKLGLDSIDSWDNTTLNEISEKYMLHKKSEFSVNEFSKVSETLIKMGETRAISAKAQGLVDSWASGNMYYLDDSIMSKTTRYRYRSLIKKACNIDILERMNIARLPIKVKTIDIKEAIPPIWYSRVKV